MSYGDVMNENKTPSDLADELEALTLLGIDAFEASGLSPLSGDASFQDESSAWIAALHGDHDGYVTVHVIRSDGTVDNPKPYGVPVRRFRESLEMIPGLADTLSIDGGASIQAMGKAWRSGEYVSHFTSIALDIDAPKEYSPEEKRVFRARALGWLIHATGPDENGNRTLPSPSFVVDSGNGLWVYWLLRDRHNSKQPIALTPETRLLWARIAKEMAKRFPSQYAPDQRVTTDLARFSRLAGSMNTKAGRKVRVFGFDLVGLTGTGAKWNTYTLSDLARELGVPPVPEELKKSDTEKKSRRSVAEYPSTLTEPRSKGVSRKAVDPVLSERGRSGQVIRWKNFARDILALSYLRNGFKEGTRNSALWLFTFGIARLKHLPTAEIWRVAWDFFVDGLSSVPSISDAARDATILSAINAARGKTGEDVSGLTNGCQWLQDTFSHGTGPALVTVADWLHITPDEAFALSTRERPYPYSSEFLPGGEGAVIRIGRNNRRHYRRMSLSEVNETNVGTLPPLDFYPEVLRPDSDRGTVRIPPTQKEYTAARRAYLVARYGGDSPHPLPSLRKLQEEVAEQVSGKLPSAMTIRDDLNALGIKNPRKQGRPKKSISPPTLPGL